MHITFQVFETTTAADLLNAAEFLRKLGSTRSDLLPATAPTAVPAPIAAEAPVTSTPAPTPAPVPVAVTVTPAPVAAQAPAEEQGPAPTMLANGIQVDKMGVPYDARIHSESKALTQDGRWRYRRNVDKAQRDQIEASLGRYTQGPEGLILQPAAPIVPVAVAVTLATPTPTPAPAAVAPEAATTTLTQELAAAAAVAPPPPSAAIPAPTPAPAAAPIPKDAAELMPALVGLYTKGLTQPVILQVLNALGLTDLTQLIGPSSARIPEVWTALLAKMAELGLPA